MKRKTVKNGFIEVSEQMVPGTFNNTSTHEADNIMRKQWVFTPFMLPDATDMPKSMEGWQEEFNRQGEKLPPLTADRPDEFPYVIGRCETLICEAYERRHVPKQDSSQKKLADLGFH